MESWHLLITIPLTKFETLNIYLQFLFYSILQNIIFTFDRKSWNKSFCFWKKCMCFPLIYEYKKEYQQFLQERLNLKM